MTTVVHFEVYVYDDVRGWALQTRYPGDERLKAIEEAKMMEFTLSKPVRVVRETYYPGSNASEEVVTYIGRIKPKPRARQSIGSGGGYEARGLDSAPFSESDIANAYPGRAGRAKVTADFAFRLIVVMIASLTVAILGTGTLSMLSSRLFMQLGIAGTTQSLLMFLIFMGLFLLTAVPLVMLYVPLDHLWRPTKGAAAPNRKKATASAKPEVNDTPEKQIEAAVAAQIEDDAGPTVPPPEDAAAAKAEAEEARAAAEKAAAEAKAQLTEDPAAAEDDAQAETGADKPTEDSLALEQSRLIMMKFLGGAVSAIKTVRPQLDAYNRFGINLYLAGACGALAEARRLKPEEKRTLIQEAVEVVGTRAEHANQLIERLDAYKSQGRYRQMIAAGKVAMEVHLSGSSDPFIALGGVVKDWNTPQAQQVASSAVTILFTDMVGSTDITHSIGDAAAQDIIRAHNHIVRGALLRHRGKEVKHTGDGIMASFDQPGDAVAAAVEIQRKAYDHTAKWPQQPLDLRIGMNTGEPIIEENDYFGATVQVAARVCAAADTGQVWLSEDTHASLPPNGEIETFDHGRVQLKGVQGETGLFEVVWNDARREELAALPPREGAPPAEEADANAESEAESAPAPQAEPQAEPVAEAVPSATKAPEPARTPAAATRPPRAKPSLDRLPPAPPPRAPRKKA